MEKEKDKSSIKIKIIKIFEKIINDNENKSENLIVLFYRIDKNKTYAK